MEIICLILIAATCMGVAVFYPDLSNTARAIIGFIGIAIVILLILLYWQLLNSIKAQYYMEIEAVKIRQMDILSKMTNRQLDSLDTHNIRVELRPTPQGLQKVYIAPGLDMSPEWVAYVTSLCLDWDKFPELPTQHGYSGREGTDEKNWRDILKAYTGMVVKMGLARHASGNKAAEWLVDENEILARLEVVRDA